MIVTSRTRETLLHVVKNLRAAPVVLAQLGRLLLLADRDLADAVVLLKRDVALTSRLIRLANSVFYSRGQRIGSLEEALAVVGFNEVYRLAGLAAVVEIADCDVPLYGMSAAQFRENALFAALIVERLASRAEVHPGEAYAAGLLRAVGKIALDRVMRGPAMRAAYSPREHGPVAEWERDELGITSCEAAAMVLENWRFPRSVVDAIRHQYVGVDGGGRLGFILHSALSAVDCAGVGLPGEQWYWSGVSEKLAAAGCGEAVFHEAVETAREEFAVVRGLLG